MSVSDQIIVVTGAASGMGRLASQRYAKAGKTVVGLDLNLDGLKETAKGFDTMHVFSVDITQWKDVESLFARIENEIGPVERLVNCAGIMPLGTLSSQQVGLIDKIMQVNYGGTVNSNKAVLPFMEKRGRGEIINFASIAGWGPAISFGAYNAAKFAVVAWSEVLHHENTYTGIKVTCVCPPPVNTPLLRNAINVPKVLKSAPAVEPDFIIDAMEKAISNNSVFCFPGFKTKFAYFGRRMFPSLFWTMIVKIEGKDFGKYLNKQP